MVWFKYRVNELILRDVRQFIQDVNPTHWFPQMMVVHGDSMTQVILNVPVFSSGLESSSRAAILVNARAISIWVIVVLKSAIRTPHHHMRPRYRRRLLSRREITRQEYTSNCYLHVVCWESFPNLVSNG